ncbi:hypothetical protein [Microseira sp. BLCC-F43]|jgi:hypothetical protein|uniref:hypothetical protein n=1 Tax=Microseira sp. BLCC-F43 TaxID=3153602 RepID=UPI0035BAD6B7
MFFELCSSSTRQLGKTSISQVWQRKYKPGRLPQKLISSLVIGSLILIVGGKAFTSYWILRSLIIKNLEEKALIEVKITSHEIDEWLAFMIYYVESLANNSSGRSMKWWKAEPFLKEEIEQPDYHMLLMANRAGYYYTTKTGFVRGKSLSDRAYFKQAIAGKANVSDLLISRFTGVRQVSIAVPIRSSPSIAQNLSTNPLLMRLNLPSKPSKTEAKPIGVLAGIVPIDRITEARSRLGIGRGSYAFALDSQGVPITYPNRLYIQEPKSFLNEANPSLAKIAKSMVNRQREVKLVQLEGEWVYVAYAPLKFTNWSVGLAIPKANLEQELTALNLLASVVGTLLFGATNAAGWQLQLFDKTKERAAQEALLNRITARIRASLDLETILQTTVDEVAQLLCLDRVMFSWYRVEEEMLEVVWEHRRQEMPSHLGYFDVKNLEKLVGSLRKCEI